MNSRISVPAYLNSRAYFHHLQPAGVELLPLMPSDAARAIGQGKLHAGLIPVGGLPLLIDQVEYLGNYGIAADGAVGSVLFFSDFPFADIGPVHTIRVTGQSATSVRLLSLLLGYQKGFHRLPVVEVEAAGLNEVDGELLIGDDALNARRTATWPYVTDLAQAWQGATGLPFVFARWVIRRDAPPRLRDGLAEWLGDFAAEQTRLNRQVADDEAVRYGLTSAEAFAYLQGMTALLDTRALAGQQRFLQDLATYRPAFSPFMSPLRVANA